MNKIIIIIISAIVIVTAVVAGIICLTSKDSNVTTLKMSDSTKAFRDELASKKYNEALKEKNFDKLCEDLLLNEQTLPDVSKLGLTNVYSDKLTYTFESSLLEKDITKPVLTLTPKDNQVDYANIVLYVHGGAFTYQIDGMHIQFCDALSTKLNAKVYMPIYPLIFEKEGTKYQFATYEDAFTMLDLLYADLLEEGKKIFIMGDSAGGALAMSYVEYLNEQNARRNEYYQTRIPDKIVVLSPWLDVSMSNKEMEEIEKKDLTLAIYAPTQLGKFWAGDLKTTDWQISPLFGNLSALPDTLFFVGTDELMYPDVKNCYNKMKGQNGRNVKLVVGEGMWHVYPIYPIAEKQVCIDAIFDFCIESKDNTITYVKMSGEAQLYRDALAQAKGNEAFKKENYSKLIDDVKTNPAYRDMPKDSEFKSDIINVYDDTKTYTTKFGNNKVLTLTPKDHQTDYENIILYIHGGAYAYQILAAHIRLCDLLATELNAKVYMPIYPLLSQNATYKSAYELLDLLYADLLGEGKKIFIMGDSAGGGLSMAYVEYLNKNNEGKEVKDQIRIPDKMVLLSPWLDVSMSNKAISKCEEKDLTLASYGLVGLGKIWADDLDVKNSQISPIYGDLSKLPDTMFFVGTDEVVYPDVMSCYNKMKGQEGRDVKLVVGEEFWHVYPIYSIPEKQSSVEMIARFCLEK